MENAQKFAQECLAPQVQHANRTETFDKSIYKKMGEYGLLGCTLSDYDCSGVSHTAYGNDFNLSTKIIRSYQQRNRKS